MSVKNNMVVGLTGGIASGKSNISRLLIEYGYTVIDADQITKSLQEPGGSIYNEIKKEFGLDYFLSDGTLNRKKLGNMIFCDEISRTKLNSICHPLIIDEIKVKIKKSVGIIFLDIPLLYETNLEYLCDCVICVYLPLAIEVERLAARDKIDLEYALKKIQSQMSLEEKKSRADYVIDSSGSFENTEVQLQKILKKIGVMENGTNRNK